MKGFIVNGNSCTLPKEETPNLCDVYIMQNLIKIPIEKTFCCTNYCILIEFEIKLYPYFI